MTGFETFNPAVITLYFAAVICFGMFTMNPAVSAVSLVCALLAGAVLNKRGSRKIHIYTFLTVVLCTLMNPLFSHNGATVLVVINNSPVTREALLYGFFMGIMLSSAVYWARIFSSVMPADKVIYTVSLLSHKSALVISMALRFIPMYARKAGQINASQRALGLYREDTIISRVRGAVRVFSALLTCMIEKTIITADSMSARGADNGRRTSFSVYRYEKKDAVFTAVIVIFSAVTVFSVIKGGLDFSFYPYVEFTGDKYTLAGVVMYALLCLCPTLIQGGDNLKWHCLKSKILTTPAPQVRKY